MQDIESKNKSLIADIPASEAVKENDISVNKNINIQDNNNSSTPSPPMTLMHDRIFKKVFLNLKHLDSLIDFLWAITKIPKKELAQLKIVDATESIRELKHKMGLFDLKIELPNNSLIGFEIQRGYETDMIGRVVHRHAALIIQQTQQGGKYNIIGSSYVIVITSRGIPGLEKTDRYFSHFTSTDTVKNSRTFGLLVHTYELNLANVPDEYDGNPLWPWMWAFKSIKKEEFDMAVALNPAIAPIRNAFLEMTKDEQEVYVANAIRDAEWAAANDLIHAELRGREEGIEEGRVEGRVEEREQVVVNMLKNNISVDIITLSTNLTKKQIKKIAKRHNL